MAQPQLVGVKAFLGDIQAGDVARACQLVSKSLDQPGAKTRVRAVSHRACHVAGRTASGHEYHRDGRQAHSGNRHSDGLGIHNGLALWVGVINDEAVHLRCERITCRVAQHVREPSVQRRFGARAPVTRPGLVWAWAQQRHALRVAGTASGRARHLRFNWQRLLVGHRHGRTRAFKIALHDLVHAFGHEQVAHAVCQIEPVCNDLGHLGPFSIGGWRTRAWAVGHSLRQTRAHGGAGVQLPIRKQRYAVHHIARANGFLRLVFGLATGGAPRVRQAQRPDEFSQAGIAQAALNAIAIQRSQRLVAPQTLQDRLRTRCAL